MGPTITLRPINGWGWVNRSGERRDVPTSFSVEVDEANPGAWKGTVISTKHEFFGLLADIAQRHARWDGDVNIRVKHGGPDVPTLAAGYAQVEDHLSLPGRSG